MVSTRVATFTRVRDDASTQGRSLGIQAGVQVPTVGDRRRGFANHQESTGGEECSVWETYQQREIDARYPVDTAEDG